MRKRIIVNKLPMIHFRPQYSLLFATCCTNLSIEEATKRMNIEGPTGIRNQWTLAEKEELPEGFEGTNPWVCNENTNWKHMYFIC